MIYHHEHNHYDVFNVISFTVIDDSLDDVAIQNVSITIVIIDCHIIIYICMSFCVSDVFVVLYYKTCNCVISFVHISFYWFISDVCSTWSYLLILVCSYHILHFM